MGDIRSGQDWHSGERSRYLWHSLERYLSKSIPGFPSSIQLHIVMFHLDCKRTRSQMSTLPNSWRIILSKLPAHVGCNSQCLGHGLTEAEVVVIISTRDKHHVDYIARDPIIYVYKRYIYWTSSHAGVPPRRVLRIRISITDMSTLDCWSSVNGEVYIYNLLIVGVLATAWPCRGSRGSEERRDQRYAFFVQETIES